MLLSAGSQLQCNVSEVPAHRIQAQTVPEAGRQQTQSAESICIWALNPLSTAGEHPVSFRHSWFVSALTEPICSGQSENSPPQLPLSILAGPVPLRQENKASVLVSSGSYNKIPQPGGLHNGHLFLTVEILEA